MTGDADDLIRRSRNLDKKIESSDIGVRLTKVDRLVRWLTFSVVFDIILSIGLGVFGWVAYSASQSAQDASTQARINCLAGNESRRVQANLWNYVLTLPPSTEETPSQKKLREENTKKFKAYIDKAFAPRDCSKAALSKVRPTSPPKNPAPAPTGKAASPASSPNSSTQATGTTTMQPQPTTAPQPQPPKSSEPSAHPSRSPPPPSHSSSPSPSASQSPGLICRVTHVCITEEEAWLLLRSALNGSTRIGMADVIMLTRNVSPASMFVGVSVPTATSLPPTTSWLLTRVTSALSSSSATPVGS